MRCSVEVIGLISTKAPEVKGRILSEAAPPPPERALVLCGDEKT